LVVLLWTSGRGTWIIGHPILIYVHESATANAPLTINGAPSLPGGPWSHIHHTPFLDTCSLIFRRWKERSPRDVIRSGARFRLCAHTLRIETVTWTHNISPTCVMLMMYKMSNTSFSLHPSTRALSHKDSL